MKQVLLIIVLLTSVFYTLAGTCAPDEDNNPATATAEPPVSRLWNLQDADILSIINEVSLETGKNFVVDPRVSGKITLVSSKPIKNDEVYAVFLSILESLGYSAIPSGNVVKIVPNMESAEMATRVASARYPGRGSEVVVRVIPLQHIAAAQLIPIIRPMLPQWSNLSVYTPGNVLILTGRAANLQRILDVVKNVDKESGNDIDIVPLRHAAAAQVAVVLSNLQNASRANGEASQITVAADERSNSILLSGNRTARIRTRQLILQLDSRKKGTQGNTEVIYLRYLQAKVFAPILGKIANNILTSTIPNGPNAPVATAVATINNLPSGGTIKSKDLPENLTNIQAEPSTNALIITAPPMLMTSLRTIVEKLDIRPAQVLIESILVEIDQSDLKQLGIQWGGRVNPNNPNQPNPAGPGFAPFGNGTVGIIPGQQIQAVLSILQQTTNVNILSTPSVVVLDNQPATLKVGQDVPTQSGSYATTGGANTVTPFNTTAYRQVVLGLQVKPQINLGNSVRLTIKLKNDTLQNPANPGLTPLINISEITNSVIVNNKDILVIGGLVSSTISHNIDKIPILGDIPLLGNLFKRKAHTLQKKNLVVFIKSIILHNGVEATAITHTKYDLARQEQIDWPKDISQPGRQKLENIIPPWKNSIVLPKPFGEH